MDFIFPQFVSRLITTSLHSCPCAQKYGEAKSSILRKAAIILLACLSFGGTGLVLAGTPTVNLAYPGWGNAPANFNLSATVSASSGSSITKVEFYSGGTLLGTSTSTGTPYTYAWTGVAAGTYTLTAKATDNQGGTGTSNATSVTVYPHVPPTVSLAYPGWGNAPANFNLSATVSASSGSSITKVEFYSGGTLLGTSTTTGSPYTYAWTGVAAGTYTLTAKATDNQGGAGTSNAMSVTVTPSTATTYSISGSAGVAGATVTAGGKSATSDTSGNYTITGLVAGTYTVSPSKTGYTFSPTSSSVTVGPSATGKSFAATATTYSISGNAGVAGATVTAGGKSATSDTSGNYTIAGLVAGTHTVTASKTGYTFSPASISVTVGPNATGKNFAATATATTYSISGSAGVAGATVTAGGKSATSDTSGNYTITGLVAGTYTVSPSKTGYTFSPTSSSVTVGPSATGKNFAATVAFTPDNPIGVSRLSRLLNPTTGHHFYTSNKDEYSTKLGQGYTDEGVAGFVGPQSAPGMLPLFRLRSGDVYLYTTDDSERNSLASVGWTYEGIMGTLASTQISETVPFFRLFNPTTGDYLYTMSPGQRDYAVNSGGYIYQGVIGYITFNGGTPNPNGNLFVSLDGSSRPSGVDRSVGDPNKFWAYAKIPTLTPDASGHTTFDIFLNPNPTLDNAGKITINGVGYALRPLNTRKVADQYTNDIPFSHYYYYDPSRPPGPETRVLRFYGGSYHVRTVNNTSTGEPYLSVWDSDGATVSVVQSIGVGSTVTSGPGGSLNTYLLPEGNGHVVITMSQVKDVNYQASLMKDSAVVTPMGIALTGDQYSTFFVTFKGHPEWGGYVFVDPEGLKKILQVTALGAGVATYYLIVPCFACAAATFVIAEIAGAGVLALELQEIHEADMSRHQKYYEATWVVGTQLAEPFIPFHDTLEVLDIAGYPAATPSETAEPGGGRVNINIYDGTEFVPLTVYEQ